MDFNWENFLKVAESIKQKSFFIEENLEEAFIRTAIGRAYYASFKKAALYLEYLAKDLSEENRKEYSHEYVIKSFKSKGVWQKKPEFVKISDNLSDLKRLRKASDYDANYHGNEITTLHASKAIKLSKQIIDEINKL